MKNWMKIGVCGPNSANQQKKYYFMFYNFFFEIFSV